MKHIPYIRNKLLDITLSLKESLQTSYINYKSLPPTGLTEEEVLNKLDIVSSPQSLDKVSGIIYHQGEKHYGQLFNIFKKYAFTNPLHPDIFPEIREMERDIVNMVSDMFRGDKNTCGNVTSGGTESILLACYTYREWGRREKGIVSPNIVVFHSIHPAFDKACHYFGIKLKKISSLRQMSWAIDSNTICIVGSAPTYAYGIVDPIEEMSKLSLAKHIPFHVDCCMGGFLLPFLEYNPVYFENTGITSISADTHKYGNCFKGSSVLLFHDISYKKHQHFIKTDWEGGMYATPTLLGSKSGAIIATTWASMLYMGRTGYQDIAKAIQQKLECIRIHFIESEDITIIGDPWVNMIAFKSTKYDIYKIVAELKEWNLSVLTNPPAFHFCITSVHTDDTIKKFIIDLEQAINIVKMNPDKELSGTLAIYGTSTKIENSLFTEDVMNEYMTF
jgi:sphinganine-1-phosphate aldolase